MTQLRKPDAFEKMVQKAVHGDAVLTQIEAVQLLRAYHRKVVRLVTRRAKLYRAIGYSASSEHGRRCAYLEILVYLNQLKKGTQP